MVSNRIALSERQDEPREHSGRADRPRLLMLSHRLPYPPDRGDRIRSYHMLKTLADHFDVAIACTSDDPVWLQHHVLLRKIASQVAIQPIRPMGSHSRAAAALLSGQPITPACFFRQALADTIVQWHEQSPFDVVLTYCTGMIHYARLLLGKANGRPLRHVLDLVDVDSVKWRSYADTAWAPMRWVYALEARRLRRIEAAEHDRIDAITVISDAEAMAYRQHVGDFANLLTVGNGVDLEYFHPLPDAEQPVLVFVGVLNYRPNVEGIAWFVEHVMPLVRREQPQLRLQIVGRHPSSRVTELARHQGVEVVGSVPDVRNYLGEAAAVIAPLQIARGVQNKVLEAMACAKPVVCSPQAAEGIDAADGEHLLVARDAKQWAEHLARLLRDPAARQRLGQAARERVESHYTWPNRLQPLVTLLKTLTTTPR